MVATGEGLVATDGGLVSAERRMESGMEDQGHIDLGMIKGTRRMYVRHGKNYRGGWFYRRDGTYGVWWHGAVHEKASEIMVILVRGTLD